MARTDPQLNFRIPAELKARLEGAAADSKRTLTAELVARLEASFEPPKMSLSDEVMQKIIDVMNAHRAK